MTLDALRLEVPDILFGSEFTLSELDSALQLARQLPAAEGLEYGNDWLLRCNRSALPLLERQRHLQRFCEQFAEHCRLPPSSALVLFCDELSAGFKRLLLQILQGRQPSPAHLAWCLYQALHYLAQSLVRRYQLDLQPPPTLWRDSHLLYWIAEHQRCLDHPVPSQNHPRAADTLRGLYQQMLLMSLSDPFTLDNDSCQQLFAALAPLAALARLEPLDAPPGNPDSLLVDLALSQPWLSRLPPAGPGNENLRRFELDALLVELYQPSSPLDEAGQALLQKVRPHWLSLQERRHPRRTVDVPARMAIGLGNCHAQLSNPQRLAQPVHILDSSAGGLRLSGPQALGSTLEVGQLVLLQLPEGRHSLGIVRWRSFDSRGINCGVRYLKGLPRPVRVSRAPHSSGHPAILQSTPKSGSWRHGLWLPGNAFHSGEQLWLELNPSRPRSSFQLTEADLGSRQVSRYPLPLSPR